MIPKRGNNYICGRHKIYIMVNPINILATVLFNKNNQLFIKYTV